ncbi:hypothetical protein [Gehongia tenuis]|uniref:Uncharacterized protein n=1 Tax=Gehongia tenuis TaxID=2763655 RepID=A0A926HP80_9FIRM|nr:hypothetical protein [Gehongia tenuis]MBC8530405.1 hypothetical protein [Gehongia tenuis]
MESRGRRRLGAALPFVVLGAGYGLIRFVLFGMHGMKDWPDLMAGAGLAVLIAAALAGGRRTAWASALGYAAGFLLGALLSCGGTDPGGGKTNNLWIIWAGAYGLFILGGIALDLWKRQKERQDSRQS